MVKTVVEKKVLSVARRIHLWHTVNCVLKCEAVLLSALLVVLLIQKLIYIHVPLIPYSAISVAVAGLIGLIWGALRQTKLSHAAEVIDEHFGLKERTLTALCMMGETLVMVPAIRRDAENAISSIAVKQSAPFRMPFAGKIIGILLVAVIGICLLPQWDLLGRKAEEERLFQEKKEIEQAAKLLARRTEERKKQLEKGQYDALLELTKEMESVAEDLKTRPPLGTTKAIEELSSLSDKIRNQQKELTGLKAAQDALRNLNFTSEKDNMLREFESALRKGDFSSAQKQLEKLSRTISNGNMSLEQMKKLAANLNSIASQLSSMSNIDPLEKALTNSNLSASERNALGKQLKKSKQLSRLISPLGLGLKNMAGAMSGLGSVLSDKDIEALNGALSDASGALSEMEQQAMRAQLLSAFLADIQQCKGCMGSCPGQGQGLWAEGDTDGRGSGFGGAGKGRGGILPERQHDTGTEATRLRGQLGEGKILSAWFSDGVQLKGETRRQYADAVMSAQQEAAQAISIERIPQEYRDHVRDYFEDLSEP